ncbi:hypothetical protein Vi05172_g5809 [Venturia inaequalis]|nr:hypothetical protein Vi05172_g5809 [Venturia inaequalis]
MQLGLFVILSLATSTVMACLSKGDCLRPGGGRLACIRYLGERIGTCASPVYCYRSPNYTCN